jgi:hypothetical protein
MRNTTDKTSSDYLILSRSHEALASEMPLDPENQLAQDNSHCLSNLSRRAILFDLRFLLDSDVSFDLEDLFDLQISDFRWDDDRPQSDS